MALRRLAKQSKIIAPALSNLRSLAVDRHIYEGEAEPDEDEAACVDAEEITPPFTITIMETFFCIQGWSFLCIVDE